MKKVLTSGISATSQQPFTKTTHDWYNAMTSEATEAIIKSLIPASAYSGTLVILSGCVLTGANLGVRTITAGWVWYNGEIYKVDAATFTTTTLLPIGVWSIVSTDLNLTFSDGSINPVHRELKFVFEAGVTLTGSGTAGHTYIFDETSSLVILLGALTSGIYNPTIGLFNGNTSVTLTGTNVANAYYKISATTVQIYYSIYISTTATYNAIRLSFPPNINANGNNFGNSSAYKQSSITYIPVITSVEQTGQGGGNGGITITSYGGGDLSNAGNTTTIQGSVIFTKI